MNRKLEMHAMIDAIENDFIANISNNMTIADLEDNVVQKMYERFSGSDFVDLLSYLDLHDYIEIVCRNIKKSRLIKSEKDFMNTQLRKLIPIRNRVMHPRPLEFDDYPILSYTFFNIPDNIKSFSWDNIKTIKKMIKENPEELLSLKFSEYEPSSDVYENLPVPEFDDTTYIGRYKERSDIKKLILNKRHFVITIKGEGGNGKTATVLKTLYDLIDSPENYFEAIIWVTLKTEHLNDVEFLQIENAIRNFESMSKEIEKVLIPEENLSSVENIINFAKNFNTLLVLDNLETLNVSDVRDFVLEFVEFGKILITSRIGLGEIERRYTLQAMNDFDALKYFDVLMEYYNLTNLYSDDEKKNLVINELYKNPLTIKWFVRSLTNGLNTNEVLNNKSNVINFCMSNVYEKVSKISKDILSACVIEDRPLSYSIITYLLGLDHSNEFDVRKGAIQLDASNFLDSNLLKEGKVNLTEISRDYLRTNHFPNKNFRDKIIRNRKKLQDLKQEMEVKNITDKYNPKSISFLNDEKYLLSGWYLIKAMEESKSGNFEKAFMLSDIAKQISPNYFEPYKISGYLYFLKKDNRAENEFKTALQLAKNDVDKAAVLLLYSTFALYRDDRHKALRLIKEALEHDGDNYDIVLEKVKILTYLGKYNEAQSILKDISTDDLVTLKLKNIYYTRYAETFRRRAERIEKRFFDGRYPLLVEAFNCLEKSPKPDYKLTNKKIDILIDIFYYYHDENAIKFFLSKVKKHYTELYQNNRFSKLYSIVRSKMSSIPYEYYIPELTTYFQDYDLKSVTIKQKNIGIITTLKEKFGFLKNSKYTNGLYFRILNNDKYYLGDLVQFKLMKNKNRSDYAKIIEVKESSFDDIR